MLGGRLGGRGQCGLLRFGPGWSFSAPPPSWTANIIIKGGGDCSTPSMPDAHLPHVHNVARHVLCPGGATVSNGRGWLVQADPAKMLNMD